MRFSRWIKRLEKKNIVSRWPHPIIPFILCAIIIIEGYFFPVEELKFALYSLAFFTLIFAIGHWIVVSILQGKA